MTEPYILLADDHVIIRRGLKVLIDSRFHKCVIKESDSLKGIKEILASFPFTHLILDMQLTDGNVIDMLPEIRRDYPDLPILIYSMSPPEIFGLRMLQHGVHGFLNKQSNEAEVIKALELFLNGKKYISAELQDVMNENQFRKTKDDNPIQTLSDREISVLNYLLKGVSVKEISIRMDLKATTVATYKARIFDKLNVSNIIELRNIADLYSYQTS